MNNFNNIFLILRPLNIFITAISVLVGAWFGGEIGLFEINNDIYFACLSAGLICGAGNVLNDIWDINIDKINKPFRPLASGNMTINQAWNITFLLNLIGLVFAFFINSFCFYIACLTVIFLTLYNTKLKRTVLWGNLTVALLTGIAFLFGGAAVGNIFGASVPAIFAFMYHLGREIFKDIEDIEGDRASGIKTLPIVYGINLAYFIAACVFYSLVLLTFVPFYYLDYSLLYLLTVFNTVDIILLWVIFYHNKEKNLDKIANTNKILKYGMLLGLFSLLLK